MRHRSAFLWVVAAVFSCAPLDKDRPKDWHYDQSCTVDEDCVVVASGCGACWYCAADGTVNKTDAERFNNDRAEACAPRYFQAECLCDGMACALCVNGKCELGRETFDGGSGVGCVR